MDGSGSLEAEEILPLLAEMLPNDLKKALTLEHAEALVVIFDDDGGGTIEIDEYVGFCKSSPETLDTYQKPTFSNIGEDKTSRVEAAQLFQFLTPTINRKVRVENTV